jgi:hypothetical protein
VTINKLKQSLILYYLLSNICVYVCFNVCVCDFVNINYSTMGIYLLLEMHSKLLSFIISATIHCVHLSS